MHRVRLDRGLAAAQQETGVPADGQPTREGRVAQQVGRGDQGFSGGLAVLAKPGGDIHRVAEIRDLALRDSALADDDGTGMNAGAEPRHDAEFLGVGWGEFAHPLFDGEEAAQRSGVAFGILAQRPGNDDLVADIGVDLPVVVGNRLVDVEEEPGDQIMHPELAELLRERGRVGDVEKHDDPLFASRPMVGSEQKATEHAAADHPAELEDRANKQRDGKGNTDDERQLIGKPGSRQRKGIQHELETDGDGRQDCRHRQRLDHEFGAQRQVAQHAAEPRSRNRGEGQMNRPAGERQAHRMDAAADVKRQRSLIERVEQEPVGDPDRDRRNQQSRQEAEMPAGVSHDGAARRR